MAKSATKAADPFSAAPEKPKRQRKPMDRHRAAKLCDEILSQLPREQRQPVLDFIRTPLQTEVPVTDVGNA